MKRLTLAAIIAVTLSPLAANAAAQFCDAPLTPAAEMNVKSTPHFQAFPDEISKAVVDFCWLGMEAARQKQPSNQVEARADIESRRWVADHYGRDGMQDNERWTLEGGLSNAMIAGYTLKQQPEPLPGAKAKNKKAAVSGVDDLLGDAKR